MKNEVYEKNPKLSYTVPSTSSFPDADDIAVYGDNKDYHIPFRIALGNQTSIEGGQISIYGIREIAPEPIGTPIQISSNSGIIEFQTNHEYCYAVVEINQYNGINTNNRVVQLLSIFSQTDKEIVFSERLTVANIFCFSQLAEIDKNGNIEIKTTKRQCTIASKMRNNFVGINGLLSRVISTSPNGRETNSYALFNSLSNLVYYGISNEGFYEKLLEVTEEKNLLASLLNIAQNPFNEVEAIYHLIHEEAPIYSPALSELDLSNVPGHPSKIPNQWTLAIKVNDSGSKNFLIGGPGYIVFDENDRAWVSNNVRQGTPNSSTWCIVLDSDGSPAKFSPVYGNELFGGGFGITPNADGSQIYLGNFGWGPKEYMPQFGSISVFNSNGSAVPLPSSFVSKAITRPQGMAFDSDGNLWACSWGSQSPLPDVGMTDKVFSYDNTNSAVVCFLKDHDWFPVRFELQDNEHPPSANYRPFDLVIDASNNVFLAAGGYKDFKDASNNINSSVWKFKLDLSGKMPSIQCLNTYYSDTVESYKQIILNKNNEVLVAGQSARQILRLSNDLTQELAPYTNNIFSPWGICEDAEGTLFVANFYYDNPFADIYEFLKGEAMDEQIDSYQDIFHYGVGVIAKGDDSNSNLITLPSGGKEVRLANGMPLYGNVHQNLHCYQPLMRMTCNVMDKVGNLWVTNNWKPNLPIDLTQNPSGDGIVIFVGVAKPLA